MRKLDLLIIKAFIGPFLLTTALSTFILLIQHMLKYFDDFVGKDLGIMVFAKLLFYFSLNMLQVALPLGVLVSSLMTFGNLGENFELTAIKSAGISLLRAMRPMFLFVILLSIAAFFFNDRVLPVANLKAYSLLYDIKNKKPTLDIQEGVFYRGLPNYTIKVKEKMPDDITLKEVIIYDHSGTEMGNKRVILADSSRMYTFMNDRYLKLELFDGNYYSETRERGNKIDQFNRTKYDRMDMVFSLASFDFDPTNDSLFLGNRQMMDIKQLTEEIDSMEIRQGEIQNSFQESSQRYYGLFRYEESEDNSVSAEKIIPDIDQPTDSMEQKEERRQMRLNRAKMRQVKKMDELAIRVTKPKDTIPEKPLEAYTLADLDSVVQSKQKSRGTFASAALAQARNLKNSLAGNVSRLKNIAKQVNKYKLEKYKKYSQAFACIVMFLIGAPLGSIIKKGGLGVPVIISIFFFIVYYVLSITGEEYAKADVMDGQYSVWIANIILFPVGLFFLRQARIDARLFDKDVYIIWWDRMMEKYRARKKIAQ